ncbi:MAG: winged helix-turn-helix transcriptional regulator [Desulfotomaculum sp.]|nr:winged helix-turn-helix transcriptional regulator [Desulfotomaculum sp.]
MQNEYAILNHLKNNYQTSQREIAENTGLSVGTINLLIKKMIKKGFIKLERINGRTLRYILTPQGIAEKTKLTYTYVKISYQQITKINKALAKVVDRHRVCYSTPAPVIFHGPRDEVLEILKTVAADQGLDYTVTSDASELQNHCAVTKTKSTVSPLVITWAVDVGQTLPGEAVVVNILGEM